MPEVSRRWLAGLLLLAVVGCDGGATPSPVSTPSVATGSPHPPASGGTSSAPTSSPPPSAVPVRPSVRGELRTVRRLALRIGPREATTAAYRRAVRLVRTRLAGLGYDVERQALHVPAGISWGVPVPAGRTWNVVARPAGFEPSRPYRLVGAHLDTVPLAPGAEDDGSGIAVLLELARLAAERPPRRQTVFVAFAAEEPRGSGDALHHFGSRSYVARMPAAERRSLVGMVAMDRVGVGASVPVCTGDGSPNRVRSRLLAAARRLSIPAQACANTLSDHWSFAMAGLPAARVGGTSYAEYHSPSDLPRVESRAQLLRVTRLLWSWLRG